MNFHVLVAFVYVFLQNRRVSGNDDGAAQILEYEFQNDGSGNYRYSFLTSNGIRRTETGQTKATGPSSTAFVVEGTYSYSSPDGTKYIVKYTADENGYHPVISKEKFPPTVTRLGTNEPSGFISLVEERTSAASLSIECCWEYTEAPKKQHIIICKSVSVIYRQ